MKKKQEEDDEEEDCTTRRRQASRKKNKQTEKNRRIFFALGLRWNRAGTALDDGPFLDRLPIQHPNLLSQLLRPSYVVLKASENTNWKQLQKSSSSSSSNGSSSSSSSTGP